MLFLNPFEVIANALQDSCRLLRPEFLNKPLLGTFTGLAVIASAIAVAGRNDVIGRVPAPLGYWDEMILRQRMPQPLRASAVDAAMIKILKALPPIFCGKRSGQISFSRYSPFGNTARMFWVGLLPAPANLTALFGVCFCPFFVCPLNFIGILRVVAPVLLLNFFSVASVVALGLYAFLLRIVFRPLPILFARFFEVGISIILAVRTRAPLAVRGQSTPSGSVKTKILQRCRKISATLRAALKRDWFVDHLRFFSTGSANRGVDGAAEQAVRAGNYAALVHAFIIPRKAVV